MDLGDIAHTDLCGNLRDRVSGQIEHQNVLEAVNELRDLLQSGPVDLPLLDLTELDQAARQHLKEAELRTT